MEQKYGGGYGHVAVVIATLSSFVVIEQNWLGGGLNKTEVATKELKVTTILCGLSDRIINQRAEKVSAQSATKTDILRKTRGQKKMKEINLYS